VVLIGVLFKWTFSECRFFFFLGGFLVLVLFFSLCFWGDFWGDE
jgi:hypothetical protein